MAFSLKSHVLCCPIQETCPIYPSHITSCSHHALLMLSFGIISLLGVERSHPSHHDNLRHLLVAANPPSFFVTKSRSPFSPPSSHYRRLWKQAISFTIHKSAIISMLQSEGYLAALQPHDMPTSSKKPSSRSNEKAPLLHTPSYGPSKEGIDKENPRKTMPWMFEKKHYIRAGYLPSSAGIREALSINPACHHNETINIYSHLVAAVVFIYFIVSTLTRPPSYMTRKDILVTTIYAVGTTICFLLSALHHAKGYRSQALHYWTHQLDIIGIVSLMSGAAVPMIHYGLYLHPHEQHFYYVSVRSSLISC